MILNYSLVAMNSNSQGGASKALVEQKALVEINAPVFERGC